MKIGILETGRPPEELDGTFGDYPGMFEDLLSGNGLKVASYAVLDGDIPKRPDEADGWLITGSKYGVYEDHPWIAPLKAFIQEVYAADLPLVGICFGHQLMAEALGGKAEKFDGGWALGAHDYRTEGGQTVTLNAFHQDQVTELPPDARVIASSPFCQYAALRYGPRVVSLQPHPEFDASFFDALIHLRGISLPTDVVKNAKPVPDADASTAWAISLILDALNKKAP